MRASGENVEGAVALELEAAEQVDAAKSEQTRGETSLSVNLLIDATKKSETFWIYSSRELRCFANPWTNAGDRSNKKRRF